MLRIFKSFLRELYKAARSIYFSIKGYENDELYYLSKLSKCCHILDKGCYTIPFQKGHSIGTYNEAKSYVEKIFSSKYIQDPCFLWCKERISMYEEMQNNDYIDSPLYMLSTIYTNPSIYSDFIKSAVSVRRFSNNLVENEIITDCILTAQSAASSCFRQTPRCYAIKSKLIIENLATNIAGLTGFTNGVPLLFCITSDIRPYDVVERDLSYIDASLFSQNLVLALRGYNIYSVYLSFQLASASNISIVKSTLSIPEYEKIILFIACGYSDSISRKPTRMQMDKILKIYDN